MATAGSKMPMLCAQVPISSESVLTLEHQEQTGTAHILQFCAGMQIDRKQVLEKKIEVKSLHACIQVCSQ